jgi:hypothetical protein
MITVRWPGGGPLSKNGLAAPVCVLANAPLADVVAEHDAIMRAAAKWATVAYFLFWQRKVAEALRDYVAPPSPPDGPFIREGTRRPAAP